jgi:hypothetical protein
MSTTMTGNVTGTRSTSTRAWTGRRQLLRALAAGGLAPVTWLGGGGRAGAQAQAPRRLVFFYTPNGTIGPEWRPRGSETGFTVGRILTPLAPHRARLLVLGGVNMVLAEAGFGSHHTRGIGGLLTGRPILMGNFRSAGPPTAGWASGISIDQHIARAVGAATRFRSLELGVQVVDAEVRGRLSYLGPSQPLPPIESPYDTFDRLFTGAGAPPPSGGGAAPPPVTGAAAERLRLGRKSVLDFLQQELGAVRGWVGGDDRGRIDAHLESIRDIERRLGAGPGQGPVTPPAAGCTPPAAPARMDVSAAASMPAVGRLQMDLLAAALACDQTRVATLMWTHAESTQSFPFIGVTGQHHTMSHAGDQDAAAQESLTRINVWYAEQLRYLLDALAARPEGAGSLLDSTVVVWMNEVGKGNNHAHRDLPVLLAGSCGGRFRTGRFLDYAAGGAAGQPHNNLLVSLANAMGVPEVTFGDARYCTGPLPNLT